MGKEQIDEEFIPAYVQPVLTPDEFESGTKFEQKPGDVFRKRPLDVALLGRLPSG